MAALPKNAYGVRLRQDSIEALKQIAEQRGLSAHALAKATLENFIQRESQASDRKN